MGQKEQPACRQRKRNAPRGKGTLPARHDKAWHRRRRLLLPGFQAHGNRSADIQPDRAFAQSHSVDAAGKKSEASYKTRRLGLSYDGNVPLIK